MTQHSQDGEGVEVLRDSANSHCFDDRIMVAGECIAFASEPWSSKIAASLAREPATAGVGREAREIAIKHALPGIYDGISTHATRRGDADGRPYMGAIREALSRAAPSSGSAIAEGGLGGSFACPICGDDKPHHHTAPVVDAYHTKGSRK